MISNHIQKSQYEIFLEHSFSTIYNDCCDSSPVKPLHIDIINRQQILYMQFQIQKKGKNFGITQSRLLKIQNNILYQVDKNQQQKQLPFPISIVIIRKIDDIEQWQQKYSQYEAKIIMKFQQRTDIIIFFRSIIQCNQIGMFLLCKIRQNQKRSFNNIIDLYKGKIADEVVKKIQKGKQLANNFKNLKAKAKLNQYIKKKLNDKTYITNFLQIWKSKAIFSNKLSNFIIILREIDIKSQSIAGFIKIWGKGMVSKQIAINNQNSTVIDFGKFKRVRLNDSFKERFTNFELDDEIQIECQINGIIWKTERLTGNDLAKVYLSHQNLQLNLTNKGDICYIRLSIDCENRIRLRQNIQINPKHYKVIDELYNNKKQRFEMRNIHKYYSLILQQYRNNSYYYTSFNRLKYLIELLRIDDLIQKFYSVDTFRQYNCSEYRGTFIYEYFIRNYNEQLYYEVQKLIWRYKQKRYKRILCGLKIFDENPKFNFTDGFYYLIKRLYQIAYRQTINRWKIQYFNKNIYGIQSITFFLSIGIIKIFSNIFIYQEFINKRALPYNSLLLMYIIKNQLGGIYEKINRIQLNIQAYFGIHFVNLFSSLFQSELFVRILFLLLEQKKQDNQNIYLYSMIAVFITIMNIVHQIKCSYTSAEHYIITFQQICKNIKQKIIFFQEIERWKVIVRNYSNRKQFQQFTNEMTQFYLTNAYTGQLGQISKQIYQQFTCYHYKNETELRKIFLFINKIDLGISEESSNINLSIFQSASKLYEHEFKGVNLNKVNHFIELKLLKLDEITIICNSDKNSYSCRIDPKQVSSNLYFHFVKSLNLSYHLLPQQNRHIFFQVYIKDNCEIDSLQNMIPNRYIQMILDKDINKDLLLFGKKFMRTFRMRQNNFNLLYSKLGWYGNHYMIPDQRLIDINILDNRNRDQNLLYSINIINKITRCIFGKAILPFPNYQNRKLLIQIIKQGIHTYYQTDTLSIRSSIINQINIYNSASRLISYVLDNFQIPTSMQFLDFYYQINQKLPLIRYLSYHPKLFYLLPTFTLQVSTFNSVSTIIISEKGIKFITQFTTQQIERIEQLSSEYSQLPLQIQFSYTDVDMYFDQFLYLLRLNILNRIIILDGKDKKIGKIRRWGNSLVSTSVVIPNYKLYNFYEVMNETKQIVQLQFRQGRRSHNKLIFNDYGLIGNRWMRVYCIVQLKSNEWNYFYVMCELTRKKYILKQNDFIRVDDRQIRQMNLSDEIGNSMQVLTYQLSRLFDI